MKFNRVKPYSLLIIFLSYLFHPIKCVNDLNVRFKYEVSDVEGGAVIAKVPSSSSDTERERYDTGSFPCLVKVPHFARDKVKAQIGGAALSSKNIYLLYFSRHFGNAIYVKWSEKPKGPFHWIVEPTSTDSSNFDELNSILFIKDHKYESRIDSAITDFTHVAMPDVHVAKEGERFILIFHGEFEYLSPSANRVEQIHDSFIASSDDLLNFNDGILENLYDDGNHHPLVISQSYMRVFTHKERYYGITKHGEIWDVPSSCDFKRGIIGRNKNTISSYSSKFDWDLSKDVPGNLYRNSVISTYAAKKYSIGEDSWVNHPFAISRGDLVEIIFWVKNEKEYRNLYSVHVDPTRQWRVVKGSVKKFIDTKDIKKLYKVDVDHVGDAYLYDNLVYFAYRTEDSPRKSAEGQVGVLKYKQVY